jgi:hypothetical protein
VVYCYNNRVTSRVVRRCSWECVYKIYFIRCKICFLCRQQMIRYAKFLPSSHTQWLLSYAQDTRRIWWKGWSIGYWRQYQKLHSSLAANFFSRPTAIKFLLKIWSTSASLISSINSIRLPCHVNYLLESVLSNSILPTILIVNSSELTLNPLIAKLFIRNRLLPYCWEAIITDVVISCSTGKVKY